MTVSLVKKLLVSLPMLYLGCSSQTLRDRIALNPNVCILDLATKEMDCSREIDDSKNLVCFTPKDAKMILTKCKENK